MLVRTCKSHWKAGGYQTHLLFHSVWTAGAVLAWLPSPSLQSPCTSTAQGPHVHVNTICMQILSPDDVIHQRDRCAGIQVTSTAVTYKRPNITL